MLALIVLHGFGRDVALASASPPPVAQILGQTIGCQELGGTSPMTCANALLTRAFEVISRDYIERRRLHASDDEIRTLAAYNAGSSFMTATSGLENLRKSTSDCRARISQPTINTGCWNFAKCSRG